MGRKKQRKQQKYIHNKWVKFGYKHTLLAILVTFLTILLLDTAVIAVILEWFQDQKYLGGFIGGMMLVSSFLAAPAVVLILAVADNVPTFPLVSIATLGSVLGDWLILKFLQDEIAVEMRPLARKLNIKRRLNKLKRSKLRHLVTFLGAFLVMLPTPDELGLSLMGIGHLKRYKILTICFFLDFVGIFGLVTLGHDFI
jgi:hypothetical protein